MTKPLVLLSLSLMMAVPAFADGPVPIVDAARAGNLDRVRTLLADPAQAKTTDSGGRTALLAAVSDNDTSFKQLNAMVQLLVTSGADVNAVDERGNSVLHLLAPSGNVEAAATATFLLEHGAQVNARNAHGATPLFLTQKADVANVWLTHGADIKAMDENGNTPLHAAAQNHAEVVPVLLAAGADANAANYDGDLPVHLAFRGYVQAVMPVLIAKSNLALKDSRA